MAETIYHGYLIKKTPFQTFDEIVVFLIASGKKVPCISMGSRKIESKNARSLFVGSYLEIQIFQSRNDEKLSKLKKVTAIKALDWNYETLESFNLLNECVNKTNVDKKVTYEFYTKCLNFIVNNTYGEKILMLIILRDFCRLSGINLEVNRCIKCGNNKIKTISFKDYGMLCNLCFDRQKDKLFDLETSKAIHHLFNDNIEALSKMHKELDFIIKLLRIFIEDNIGIQLSMIKHY